MTASSYKKRYFDELRYNLSQDLRKLRYNQELSVEQLSHKTAINIIHLRRLEMGNFEEWGLLIKLAKFYNKKIRIVLLDDGS